MADSPILTAAQVEAIRARIAERNIGLRWDEMDALVASLAAAREALRAIELCVDGLNMKGFTPKPAEKEALERIKRHCREQLLALGEENAPNG